ncbi:Cytosolic 5'-nucleotidase 1A [Takifugu flavidus]|uniref:Cytosolic 5'-nucleotidase 1A n=1 Tax=Takifugu flavidus TaxID=433684 RepID=A0A5C6NE34_9TELE|nr:Cytosolic 5'-nucleotidase 1A [Takifugu flavidus]
MVRMSLDPVQVMTGQVKELKVATSANGDGSRGSWEEKEEFQRDDLGLKTAPKAPKPQNAVTVAVSSRVLFRTEREQKVFEQQGVEEYLRYQIEHENEPFAPGPAFPFVKALETVNARLRDLYPQSEELFDIVLVTYNHAHVGIRLINTINHHTGDVSLRPNIAVLSQLKPKLGADIWMRVRLSAAANCSYFNPPRRRRPFVSHVCRQRYDKYVRKQRILEISDGCRSQVNGGSPPKHLTPSCGDLFIERFCMTGGTSPIGYLKAWHTNLYLSADADKVREALAEGIAAATMFTAEKLTEVSESQLRVAFDGDAVLFSDESERIFKAHGLDKFFEHERENEDTLLDHGPLKGFLEALGKLQKKFYAKGQRLDCPIRTYLVTARSAASSGIRALKTLRAWGLEIDEALFLAGAPKGPMLEKIRPHIYFDDQMFHVEGAAEMGTIAAHVPYGIAQHHTKRNSSGGK